MSTIPFKSLDFRKFRKKDFAYFVFKKCMLLFYKDAIELINTCCSYDFFLFIK